jgi:hypothetical protein
MADSPFDAGQLRRARELLAEPPRDDSLIGLTAAAVCFAGAALALVAVVISLPSPWPA